MKVATISYKKRADHFVRFATKSIIGSIFIALCAQITIPIGLVPFTMQTFAIVFLGLISSPMVAFASALAYLTQASLGLPVLAGGKIVPLFFIGPHAGYLLSFPVVAYAIAFAKQKWQIHSSIGQLAIATIGAFVILLSGMSVLAFYVGISAAFIYGFLPFIIGAIMKSLLASGLSKFSR